MENCPNCNEGELEQTYVDIGQDWIHIVLKCNFCKRFFQGDLQIEHFVILEEGLDF